MKIAYYSVSPLTSCYDKKTEVLTSTGWRSIREIVEKRLTSKIATLNPKTNEIEYHKPRKWLKQYWKGKMIHFYSRALDLLVTPNHNVWIGKKNRRGEKIWRFTQAKDLVDCGNSISFQRDGIWRGEEKATHHRKYYGRGGYPKEKNLYVPMTAWMEFLGYYIGDGYTVIERKNGKENGFVVGIRQKKEKNPLLFKRIYEVFSKITPYTVYKNERGLMVRDKWLCLWLRDQVKKSSDKERKIPYSHLQLSANLLSIMYQGILKTDGSIGKYGNERIFTSSPQLRDNLQEVLLKMGYAGTNHIQAMAGDKHFMKKDNRWITASGNIYEVTKVRNIPEIRTNRGRISEVDYDGWVYCVEVPNHLLYVRRNGKPIWCGNSGYGVCTKELVYRLLEAHEVDIFAYHGVQNAEITIPLNGNKGPREVKIIGGTGALFHPILADVASHYDLILSHWDQWMFHVNPSHNWSKTFKTKICNWVIFDHFPVSFPVRYMFNSPNFLCGVPMTKWAENELKNCPDIPSEKVAHFIPHGINPNDWYEDPVRGLLGIPEEAFLICSTLSNMGMRENIPEQIEAFALFLQETNANAYYYLHTDPRPHNSGYNLNEIISGIEETYRVGLPQRLLLKRSSKPFPRDWLRKIYSKADVQLCAIKGGSFELPILEGGLCGTPSIVTNFSGPAEIIHKSKGGIAVKPSGWIYNNLSSAKQAVTHPYDIARALKRYYEHPELRRRHAERLRKWLLKYATWDIVAEKWLDLLGEIEKDTKSYGRSYYCDRVIDTSEYVLINQRVRGKVLEIGCGEGGLIEFLKKNGCEVAGIEISEYAVERCKEKSLEVYKANAENLPFENDSFDFAISQHVLEHCNNYEKVLEESLRVAREGVVHIVPGHESRDITHVKNHFTQEDMDEIAAKFMDRYEVTVVPEGESVAIDWILEIKNERKKS